MDNDNQIQGGATLWARQTIDSEIFLNKPHAWFKIWFYLVNRVAFKNDKQHKRGELFLKYEWICDKTKVTKNQIDSFMRWAKVADMLTTSKTTRGFIVKIANYSKYQTLDNYYYNIKTDTESDSQPKQNRNRTDTIQKNDKNVKNDIYIAEASSAIETVPNLLEDNQKHIQIIGLFAKAKNINFENKEQQSAFIKRNLRSARSLSGYNIKRIVDVMKHLIDNADFKWTLESVGKYIDEDLVKINNQSEDDKISSFFDKYK